MSSAPKSSFPAFFACWALQRKWVVPDLHWRAVHWLENRGELAVMRVFRGAGKSTLLAVYNAWRLWCDKDYRILHQSESDGTAYKTSRDTQAVLRQHPWTRGTIGDGGVENWWVNGATDPRNASMYAKGILSNVTSARADECQNDDIEVPRNIQTPEAREKLRYRLGEQTFILVPGGRTLYVGTPHTHDSLYDDIAALGADCLSIPLFAQEHRIDSATGDRYPLPFAPEFVFVGIGQGARLLEPGADYRLDGDSILFRRAPGGLVDFYTGCAWPARFDRADLLTRRRKTRTINYWDSQYQLHSKPIHDIRLDPDRLSLYDVEPHFDTANKQARMWLGGARIVGASVRWDPAGSKPKSDVSALAIVLQDDQGRRYWHRAMALSGDVAEFDRDGKTITGGQVFQIAAEVQRLQLRRVNVETNGAGTFAPAILKAALKQRGLTCGVSDEHETRNKNKAILEAFEPLLSTAGMLWAHVSVADGPAFEQMRQWNPAIQDQPDDYLDSAAKAITDQPERVGVLTGAVRIRNPEAADDWRPGAGVFEVELTV